MFYRKHLKNTGLLTVLLVLFMFLSCRCVLAPDDTSSESVLEQSYETSAADFTEADILPEEIPAETAVLTEELKIEPELTEKMSAPPTTPESTTMPPTTTEPPLMTVPPTAVPVATEPPSPREPAVLSKENLLSDFDYFARTLEESFPFYGAARRKFGVDLTRQINLARAEIERLSVSGNSSRILNAFADILSRNIVAPMRLMGHLQGLWAGSSSYKIQLALIKWDGASERQWYPNLYAAHLDGVFTSPTAFRYYGDVLAGIDLEKFITDNLRTPVADNVSFSIIEPGSVAYMRMNAMPSANYAHDGALIAAFGETIADFDHFIIDLRGNRGGSASNFLNFVIAPLIDEPATMFYYVFFKGGQHAMKFDDIYYRDLEWQLANGMLLHADASRFPVGDILPELTQANADDFADLSYGFKREIRVSPSANRWSFKGKIWILTDGRTISAGEISAATAKESGFATVVGENTGGAFGGYTAAFVDLPNTGIIMRYDYGYITDLHGRSIEEHGVAPNIYNRPGLDAYQTVMALIAEGNY